MHKLGIVAREPISGIVGTITGRCEYLGDSTPTYRLEYSDSKGDRQEIWLPEGRIEVTTDQD